MAEKRIRVVWEIDNKDLALAKKIFDETAKSIGVSEQEAKKLTDQFDKYNKESKEQLGIIEKLRKEEEELRKARDKATDPADVRKYNKELENTRSKINKLENTGTSAFKSLGSTISDVGKIMGSAFAIDRIAGFFSGTVGAASDFEASMSRVKALTSASSDQFDRMSDLAKELGANTQFSATQASEAMIFLAQAGFNTEQIIASLPGTLDLAAAGQLDLAQSADIASNVLSAYGLQATEINRVNDMLAFTANNANTNVTQFAEAFKTVGPIAKGAKLDISEVSAAIGILGNSGIQGSQAGTGLRGVIASLSKPSKEASDRLKELGITVTDNNGNLRNLTDIFGDLNKAGADTNDFFTIFGRNAGSVAQVLATSSEEFATFTEEVGNVEEGFAKAIAETQLDNFKGSLVKLGSAFEGFAISVGEIALPVLRTFVDIGASVLGILSQAPAFISNNLAPLAALTGAVALLNVKRIESILLGKQGLLNLALERAAFVATTAQTIIYRTQLAIATGVKATFTTATGLLTGKIKLATIAQKAFNLAMKANPVGVVIGVTTALATAYFALSKSSKQLSVTEQVRADINRQLAKQLAEVQQVSNKLFDELEKGNVSTEVRSQLITEINNKYGRFLENQLTEASTLEDIKKARDRVNQGLRQEILLKIKQQKIDALNTADLERQLGILGDISKQTGISAKELQTFAEEGRDGMIKFKKALEDSGAASKILEGDLKRFGNEGISGLQNSVGDITRQFFLYQQTAQATKNLIGEVENVTNELIGTTIDLKEEVPEDSIIPGPSDDDLKAWEDQKKLIQDTALEAQALREEAELFAAGGEETEIGLQMLRDREIQKLVESRGFKQLQREDEKSANLLIQKIEQDHQEKIFELREAASKKEEDRRKAGTEKLLAQIEEEFEAKRVKQDEQLLADLQANTEQFGLLAEKDKEGREMLEMQRQEIEEEFRQARIENEIEQLEAQKELLLSNGEDVLAIEADILQKRLSLDKEYLQQKKKIKKDELNVEKLVFEGIQQLTGQLINIGQNFVKLKRQQGRENLKSEKAIFEATKVATLAQNTFAFAQQTAKIWATFAAVPVVAGLLTAAASADFFVRQALIATQEFNPTGQGFAEGVINLQGPGTETSDSIPARLSRGESVMTAKETRDFMPTLKAIRQHEIDPKILNDFVEGREASVNVSVKNEDLVAAIKELPLTVFSWDQDGFNNYQKEQNDNTESLNTKYSF